MQENKKTPKEAAEVFLKDWHDAARKCEELVQLHVDFERQLDGILERMETHSFQHNRTQKVICGAQVAAATAVVVTGGAAAFAIAPLVLFSKFGTKVRQRNRVKRKSDAVIEILNKDHGARHEFIEAAHRARKSRDALCEHCPHLKGMSLNHLALGLTYPGLLKEVTYQAAVQGLLYAAEEHPEATETVALELLNMTWDAIEFIGVDTSLALAVTVLEVIPIIGLGINLAKLRCASNALRNGSQEAAELGEAYTKSKAHYESLQEVMHHFQ
jgi:hypothetical protein